MVSLSGGMRRFLALSSLWRPKKPFGMLFVGLKHPRGFRKHRAFSVYGADRLVVPMCTQLACGPIARQNAGASEHDN